MSEDEPQDQYVAYGASCTWWDNKSEVGDNEGLPCCPECDGTLYEREHTEWYANIDNHENTHQGYAAFMEWLKGKCFVTLDIAKEAYVTETDLPTDF